jgi:hypothetical protein
MFAMLRLLMWCGVCLAALARIWVAPAQAFQAETTTSPTPETSTPAVSTPSEGLKIAVIISPLPGQALQGTVPIVVNTAIEGFEAAELAFAYAINPTGTWFTIFQGNQPVAGESLAQWDTSQISDGVYTLRLIVKMSDGTQQTVDVAGLRVRNYTAIESDTPTPVTPSATPPPKDTTIPSATPTPTGTPLPPTPTLQPTNPAILGKTQVLVSVAQGGLVAAGLFALAGLYGTLRWMRRPRP